MPPCIVQRFSTFKISSAQMNLLLPFNVTLEANARYSKTHTRTQYSIVSEQRTITHDKWKYKMLLYCYKLVVIYTSSSSFEQICMVMWRKRGCWKLNKKSMRKKMKNGAKRMQIENVMNFHSWIAAWLTFILLLLFRN